ncbi:MAG TPA: GFA family protein [Candidatus Binataceae bacterium]|nr:GFA family protein [Candidatus Binataceae bacterium]
MIYSGGCHCGRNKFEVEGDLKKVMDCNCSICTMRGYLHWGVLSQKLQLITPESNLATYTFKSGMVKHHFCPICGCAPLVSSPDGVYVNARCLEGVDLTTLKVEPFDGRSL